MQHRMRDYPLSLEETKFLAESQAGTVATVGPDGVPVAFRSTLSMWTGPSISTVCRGAEAGLHTGGPQGVLYGV